MKFSHRTIFIIILITVNIAVDQISKFWVQKNVEFQSVTEVIGTNFTLRHVKNTGAFLGLGSDLNPVVKIILLLILPIIVLTLVLRHIIKDKDLDQWSLIGFCCIIGGGIANVFDRFAYGSVVDFLHIDLGSGLQTGIFNLADVSVTSGMIMLLIGAFLNRKKPNDA